MSRRDDHQIPDDLREIDELLRAHQPEAAPLELDRMKLQVKARAAGRGRTFRPRMRSGFVTSRIASLSLMIGLLGGGTAALASTHSGPFSGDWHWNNSSHGHGASHSEYCPPDSHGDRHKKGKSNDCNDDHGHHGGGGDKGHGDGGNKGHGGH